MEEDLAAIHNRNNAPGPVMGFGIMPLKLIIPRRYTGNISFVHMPGRLQCNQAGEPVEQ